MEGNAKKNLKKSVAEFRARATQHIEHHKVPSLTNHKHIWQP
jgi:hypothetical protein